MPGASAAASLADIARAFGPGGGVTMRGRRSPARSFMDSLEVPRDPSPPAPVLKIDLGGHGPSPPSPPLPADGERGENPGSEGLRPSGSGSAGGAFHSPF